MAKKHLTSRKAVNWRNVATPAFDAVFTEDQVEEGVRKAEEDWGWIRRAALVTLARSSEELRAHCKDPDAAEFWLDLAEHLNQYLEWRKAEGEMLETARARILSVLVEFQKRQSA